MSHSITGALHRDDAFDTDREGSSNVVPSKRSVRLDGRLVGLAAAVSDTVHRSVPNQIEFWAALGRAVEHRLTTTETQDLLSGARFVARVECATAASIDPDDVFAALEADRASGALAARMPRTAALYDSVGAPDGLVRRVDTDGTESFGRFEEGAWRSVDRPA